MTFASVAIAALALAAPAAARRSRPSGSVPPAPPTTVIDSGNVNEHDTSSSTSTASCTAEVKASTTSAAQSSFVDLITEITLDFCLASSYFGSDGTPHDKQVLDGHISAVATLLLESKLNCDAEGKYAIACARSWAGAYSFAAAGVELYASAWADGSNGLDKCNCAVDVFASADALTSSWAEIWVSIYTQLDDKVCAQSYDGTADSVKSEININCVGNLVLNYWVKAVAEVISKGKCEPKEYLACQACCKNPQGGYIPDCDYEDCQRRCRLDEHATLIATAETAINYKRSQGSICTVDGTINYHDYWYQFQPKSHFKVKGAEETLAECKAIATSGAWATSASQQAIALSTIWKSTCNPLPWKDSGSITVDDEAQKWANAYVKVLVEAHTDCVAKGGDIEYDGGCALAVSYSKAFAAACAEAFALSFVDFAYGQKDSCECDIAVSVLSTNIAHEIDIISAFYETEVEARSCTNNVAGIPDESYIKQVCWANSMADMIAKSMATVSLEGSCAPSGDDKKAYCAAQPCVEYETYTDDWHVCLEECEKNTDASVTAALEASATINVSVSEYCTDFEGTKNQKFGETYLTALNGYATSTQTP